MKKEMTRTEMIKFIKDYISAKGTTEKLERLLYRMEREGGLQADLIPDDIFHDPIWLAPKLQREYPEYDWSILAVNGRRILGEMEVTS